MAPESLKKLTALQGSPASEICRIHSRFEESVPLTLTHNIVEKRLDPIEKI